MKEPQSAGDIVDDLEELAEQSDSVSIADTVDAFGPRSWGPLIAVPALLEITPLGGIPGVPTFLAVIVALVAIQMVIGRDDLWLPKVIEDRAVESGKVAKSAEKLEPVAAKLDHWFKGRAKRFTKGPWPRIAGILILLLCLTVPPLEMLPFASSAPMLAIACFGIALMVRDGILMLVACGLAAGSLALGTYLMLGSSG